MSVLAAPFRVGALARAAFRPFARTRIPDELIASWMAPGLHDPDVRRDLKKVTAGMNKRFTLEAARKLRGSELPLLLTWAPGDRFFPISYAERLAAEVPNARIVQIPGAKTFVPLDEPKRLADEIAGFIAPQSLNPREAAQASERQKRASCAFFSQCASFRLVGQSCSVPAPYLGRRAMAKEIFDQERPRSAMARRLDEAFAGCEQWTLAPPVQRRAEMTFSPRLSSRRR